MGYLLRPPASRLPLPPETRFQLGKSRCSRPTSLQLPARRTDLRIFGRHRNERSNCAASFKADSSTFFFLMDMRLNTTTRNCSVKSRSTSWSCGVSPSAPVAPGSSNKMLANARAAVHDNKEPTSNATLAPLCSSLHSPLAFARASKLKNVRVSGAHLPPTSTSMTTSLARARGPTNSGYVLDFRSAAAVKATPSSAAARRRGVPADADFGQTDFGQQILTDFGQNLGGQADFGQNWCFSLLAFFSKKKEDNNKMRKKTWKNNHFGAPKGGAPKPRKMSGPEVAQKGGPEGGRPKVSRFFSISPPLFRSLCLSLGSPSVEFLVVFEASGPEMCTFGVLWVVV